MNYIIILLIYVREIIMDKIKSTNALMKYLRNSKNISVSGSSSKIALLNIGYYHAYKGCRFYRNNAAKFNITNFSQIQAIYDFDTQIKSLLYPKIMFIETAIKNRALQIIVETGKSCDLAELFDTCFTAYKDYPTGTPKYRDYTKKCTGLKSKVYGDLYKKLDNVIISHFIHQGKQVPIWSLFEILTLGEFCHLYECLNKSIKLEISRSIGINSSRDNDGLILFYMINELKGLRNAIAHNSFIYDTRFAWNQPNLRLTNYLSNEMQPFSIDFSSITDYIILITYLLKNLKVTKTELKKFLKQFSEICDIFYNKINSLSIFNKIIPTNTRNKIEHLEKNI